MRSLSYAFRIGVLVNQHSQSRYVPLAVEQIPLPQSADPTPHRLRLYHFRSAVGVDIETFIQPSQPHEAFRDLFLWSSSITQKNCPRPFEHQPNSPTPPGIFQSMSRKTSSLILPTAEYEVRSDNLRRHPHFLSQNNPTGAGEFAILGPRFYARLNHINMKFDSIASICLYLIDRTKSSISLVMIKVSEIVVYLSLWTEEEQITVTIPIVCRILVFRVTVIETIQALEAKVNYQNLGI
ncbi:Uncharacterized protein APZ42_029052 [Daphnia magna]|uniref:Uncharacterized protein n=1 Tax=Daphnia magna TaxID=35525 RepID=A0A164PYT6_9CRUS|nr:Uncharacterized protein APZ42_029052 [Daphnia magna]